MPSKKPSTSSSSSKTRSSKSTSSRSLKPGNLLPLSASTSVVKKKKAKVHKAKDTDLREQLNEEDNSLRKALEADKQPKGPIVEKKVAPKELGPGGSDLAKAMNELEMAFAV
ncbi:hypothetical protein JCM5353_007584 [Sporobolomyces roseus]